MISVEEALEILSRYPFLPKVEILPFESALGRVIAEPIIADRDFPAYHRVAMDGIAVDSGVYLNGQRKFFIEKTIAAGMPAYTLDDSRFCVEIMTGAVLPVGCDTVIPYEEVEITDGIAEVRGQVQPGQNVHRQGADRRAGDTIVPKGTLMAAPDIGIAATVGMTRIKVYEMPRICLISTGDELVPVDETPAAHQIRSSNSYALKASLDGYYGSTQIHHLPDDEPETRRVIAKLLDEFQILIFIGGSSMGKFDFLPNALRDEGVREEFYKIRQRPGKPFWFGHKADRFVFALPGNPVSSFLCLEKYFKYWLDNSLSVTKKRESAQLVEDYTFTPDLTYFLQVTLENQDGIIKAKPLTGGGSGDHANLAEADAFIELPRGRAHFKAGDSFNLIRFR